MNYTILKFKTINSKNSILNV
ncbi:WxcM-like domain-containing protein, partial [Campylobacter jejuni]|nr:WxcM-like domain-containing protein [Campylobacter jejuni]EAL6140184.1 WxcM-like domain-containing protein [Campylobacter jejuni]ECP6024503.1 WxcM-like domain-containing protein [Campylobacter jejuni]